jgi:oxygen-independent coproporphyrinogen III oxidase
MASIYLHIPYCERKCIYCDFYSIENMSSMEHFLASLKKEIAMRAEEYSSKETIGTIFFGGGTPSLLSPHVFDEILTLLHRLYTIEPNAEITCESNPGTVEQQKLKDFRSVGFNRISIGIQSFYEDDLDFLSRIHSAVEAESAVANAYRAGFENVNCDLIFALPKQTPERWRENLRRAMRLQPKHISAYALIVEDQTPLATMVKDKLVHPLPDNEDAEMYRIAIETLCENGYEQYEVSNFALPGYECRHNINYWNHSNYISFGPSAHSFWKDTPVTGKRWWNVRSVQSYCSDIDAGTFPVAGEEVIDVKKMFNEEIFLGFRSRGIDLKKIKKLFGKDIGEKQKMLLHDLEKEKMILRSNDCISLTPHGYMICDEIAEKFVE